MSQLAPMRALRVIAGALATLAAGLAHGQPQPALAQLAHRAWTARDGAPGGVQALAQTRDGFLWIGGMTGLVRFDGVRFERYEAPRGQTMPSNSVDVLAAFPDGSLWVGYNAGGVSTITAGRLTNFGTGDGLPAGTVNGIVRDSSGATWVGTTRGLARLVGARWRVAGPESGYPGGFVSSLTVDPRGALWVAASTGVYVRPRGAGRFVRWAPPLAAREDEVGSGAVRAAPDGSVWAVSLSQGLTRLTDTAGRPLPLVPYYSRDVGTKRGWWTMTVDRHAGAWSIGAADRLVRVALPGALPGATSARPDAAMWDTLPFTPSTGKSGRIVFAVLEDREGSIWLGTDGGLDQLRVPKFLATTLPYPDDLPAIVAADAGEVWVGSTRDPLTLVSNRAHTRDAPRTGIMSAHRDLDGDVWVGGFSGLWHARGGHFTAVPLPGELQNGFFVAISRARDGTLWVSGQRRGTFRRRGATWHRYGAPDSYANAITADSAGRTWLGYTDGRLVREGLGPTHVYGPADGLRVGSVLSLAVEGDRLWVGGELGAAVLDVASGVTMGGTERARFTPLVPVDEPLRTVSGVVPTGDAVWLRDADGVARVPSAEVSRAQRDSGYRVRAERFDARDRVDRPALYVGPNVVRGTDGRVWVAWMGGLGWIDPAHVPRNLVPPPVQVRGLTAGGQSYAAVAAGRPVTLPERTRALSIAYTALSLAVPERVRFRYRLVGLDTAWQDGGARREAFYTNLGPGPYRFEVTAANDDGVWSVAPAVLDVVIPPAFVQTGVFRAMCVVAAGAAAWALAAWRQRRAADALRARFAVTLAERTRIARELHDTLLQGFTGVTLQVHAAQRVVLTRPREASDALERAVANAHSTLSEARHMVWEMRAPELDVGDLTDALTAAARDAIGARPLRLRLTVRGERRRLPRAVEVTALRIAREAVLNAVRHAEPQTVEVSLAFGSACLTMSVRDDGRGFAAADLDTARRGGHWGLVGMQERARDVGGTVEVTSTPGHGTLISIVLPLHSPSSEPQPIDSPLPSPPEVRSAQPGEGAARWPNDRRAPTG